MDTSGSAVFSPSGSDWTTTGDLANFFFGESFSVDSDRALLFPFELSGAELGTSILTIVPDIFCESDD